MKKSQTSMEAAVLITFMVIVLVFFMLVIVQRMVDTRQKTEQTVLNDISEVVQNELSLASASENGYYREFTIPPTLLSNNDYRIMIYNSTYLSATSGIPVNYTEVLLNYTQSIKKYEVWLTLPPGIYGNMCPGVNIIRKENQTVYVNGTNCYSIPIDAIPGGVLRLTCAVTPDGCTGTPGYQQLLFKMSSLTNAHAEERGQSNYAYSVCCNVSTVPALQTDCNAGAATMLKLSSLTNSHMQEYPIGTYTGGDICLRTTGYYDVICAYRTTCEPDENCVVSISGTTNAHVSRCASSYPIRICCTTRIK